MEQQRESAEFDVVIIGAGPAGLAAAIRLKQLNADLTIAVLEKGAAVEAHILSGAVVDPAGISRLLADWQSAAASPFTNPVRRDGLRFLTARGGFSVPQALLPPGLSNKGAYIVSLGAVCRFLAAKAEALGVDIFPGFAAANGLFNQAGALIGVETGDMGRLADGRPGPGFAPGMNLLGKYILLAEGARGSLSQQIIQRYGLAEGRQPQKYGLGLKEIWQLAPEKHEQGRIEHYLGWPLGRKATGGGFAYHLEGGRLALGLVVHLDYANPYLSPFEEFQQWKSHPELRALLAGAKRLEYGARVINEGGWQSVPRLSFKGGALIGCAAGFVNLPRIKGSHNAVLSAILAAEKVAAALAAGRAHDEINEIEAEWRASPIGRDLYPVRNVKPLLERLGSLGGMALGGLDIWCGRLLHFSPFGTLSHKQSDAAALKPAAQCRPINYPKPDNIVSFDRPSSVFLANIAAREDAPCHLKIGNMALQQKSEWGIYAGPSARYCPAGVYEWQPAIGAAEAAQSAAAEKGQSGEAGAAAAKAGQSGAMRYCIFAQNCVHCKTCDIKDPNGNIRWTVPEGGEGPIYRDM